MLGREGGGGETGGRDSARVGRKRQRDRGRDGEVEEGRRNPRPHTHAVGFAASNPSRRRLERTLPMRAPQFPSPLIRGAATCRRQPQVSGSDGCLARTRAHMTPPGAGRQTPPGAGRPLDGPGRTPAAGRVGRGAAR